MVKLMLHDIICILLVNFAVNAVLGLFVEGDKYFIML